MVTSEGPDWQEQRRFMLKQLSYLGVGKSDQMEDIISDECRDMVQRCGKIMYLILVHSGN